MKFELMISKQIIYISVLVFLSGCASTDEWTRQDTWMQVGVTVAIMADAYTTSKIQHHDGFYESNPLGRKLLGTRAGTKETYMFLTSWAISNYLISRMLPAKWRPLWQYTAIVGHGAAAVGNCQAGLGCKGGHDHETAEL